MDSELLAANQDPQRRNLEGLIVPLVTAFNSDGKYDRVSQERVIGSLENYADGVFPLGLTGEFMHVDHHTAKEIMDTTVVEVAKWEKTPTLVLGVTGNGYDDTLKRVEAANSFSPDGMVFQPSYLGGDPVSLVSEVAGMSNSPVYLYANPATAKDRDETLTPQNISKISKIGNVKGLKASVPYDILVQYCDAKTAQGFQMYIGNAIDIFRVFPEDENLRNPPVGVVSGPANFSPRAWANIWGWRNETTGSKADERLYLGERYKWFEKKYKKFGNPTFYIKEMLRIDGILASAYTFPPVKNSS